MPMDFNEVNTEEFQIIKSGTSVSIFGSTPQFPIHHQFTSADLASLSKEKLFAIAYKAFFEQNYASQVPLNHWNQATRTKNTFDQDTINAIIFRRIPSNEVNRRTNLLYETVARLFMHKLRDEKNITLEKNDFTTIAQYLKRMHQEIAAPITEELAGDFRSYTQYRGAVEYYQKEEGLAKSKKLGIEGKTRPVKFDPSKVIEERKSKEQETTAAQKSSVPYSEYLKKMVAISDKYWNRGNRVGENNQRSRTGTV